MKKSKNKLAALLLSAVMIMSLFTGLEISSAAEDSILYYLKYEIIDDEVAITGCNDSISGDVVVPDTIEGYSVTSFRNHAFAYCRKITEITIPESVTSIGDYAFNYCSSLQKITVDKDNKYFTSDDSGVLFDKDKTKLIRYSPGNTGTEYVIPEGVTTIGLSAFDRCLNLTKIIIPDSVITIGDGAFDGCEKLAEITIPQGVTSIGFSVFTRCKGLTEFIIPEGVTSIGLGAFVGCTNIKSISIPDSVQSIDDNAFSDCSSLTSITIPDGITSIQPGLFEDCSNLTEVVIPDSVTTIGLSAFENCKNIESITLPDRVVLIDHFAFMACTNLKSITIPPNVATIGVDAFSLCPNLTSITFLSTDCSFERAGIPSNTTILGYPGSTAESYASASGNPFIALEGEPPSKDPTIELPVSDKLEVIGDTIIIEEYMKVSIVKTKSTAADVIGAVKNEKFSIVDKNGNAFSDDAFVGTGAMIQIEDNKGNIISTYTILVHNDIDGNGKTTAADARLALRSSAKLEKIEGIYAIASDSIGDGKVTAADARRILRISAGLEKA